MKPEYNPIAWAVYLGCTTAERLASEWRIRRSQAEHFLWKASQEGLVVEINPGVFQAVPGRTA